MDYDNLGEDTTVKTNLITFRESIKKIENIVELATNTNVYNELDLKDKVNYDLFMAYTLNTLYWLYLKTKNVNPNKNDVKNQLSRLKTYMGKRDQAIQRNTIRPRLDQKAAERFVKHGINYTKKKNE